MTLSKKKDWSRRVRSFRRHSLLTAQPVTVAMLVTILWRIVRRDGIHFDKEDENVVLAGITVLSVTFGVLAGFVFASVWEKYKIVIRCIFTRDLRTFLQYRDDRMPVLVHIMLFCLSVPMLFLIYGLDYRGTGCGEVVVFSATLGAIIVWVAATELENPAKSVWLAERVPAEWLTIDVDEHFKLDRKKERHEEREAQTSAAV